MMQKHGVKQHVLIGDLDYYSVIEGGFWAGVQSPGEPPLERMMLPVVIRP